MVLVEDTKPPRWRCWQAHRHLSRKHMAGREHEAFSQALLDTWIEASN
jgi:hypothetical protein